MLVMEMAKNKKNGKNKNKIDYSKYNKKVEVENDSLQVSKVVKCVVGTLLVFALFYLFTLYITDKNMRDAIKVGEANIQYEVILAGESFNQNEDDYFVLYFDEAHISEYSATLSEYHDKEDNPTLYKCYTNEALNKKHVSSDITRQPEKPEHLRVSEHTLIRYKDHKVVEYITGKAEIISYLENL